MGEELTKKNRVRGGHKASTMWLIHQVRDIVAAEERDEPTLKQLRMLKLGLEEKLSTLGRLDGEIVNLIEDEGAMGEEIEQADDFKQEIYEAIIDIDRCCEAISKGNTPDTATGPDPHSHGAGAQVKLPKLVIWNFSGDITSWTTFWDSFESAIDQNPGLSILTNLTI